MVCKKPIRLCKTPIFFINNVARYFWTVVIRKEKRINSWVGFGKLIIKDKLSLYWIMMSFLIKRQINKRCNEKKNSYLS